MPRFTRCLLQEFSRLKRQAGDVPGIAADVAEMLRERGQVGAVLVLSESSLTVAALAALLTC